MAEQVRAVPLVGEGRTNEPGGIVRPRRRARTTKPHALIVVQNMPVPLDRRVWQECQALIAAGFDVTVICPRGDGQRRRQVVNGVEIRTYRAPSATEGLVSYVFEFVYCWLRTAALSFVVQFRHRIDVMQACNPPDTYFALALLHRPFGTRFVYDQHDLCPEVYMSRFGRHQGLLLRGLLLLERLTYRCADHVIATNDSYRATAMKRGGVSAERVTVVRSGPDPTRMVRTEPRPELRRGRQHLCCWLGIMGPQDGVDLLLDSIQHLVRDLGCDDVHFALLGYGDCLPELRRRCESLQLGEWVTLPGKVGPAEIAAYFSTADIGLSADPSSPLNDVSTMNKTMEYMAYELPVVAYDLPETRVSAGPAALYVEPNDVFAYAKAIAELLGDPQQRAEMGAAGRERVERHLAWEHQVPGYVAAMAHVANGHETRSSQPQVAS